MISSEPVPIGVGQTFASWSAFPTKAGHRRPAVPSIAAGRHSPSATAVAPVRTAQHER
jgi:hypothetical protein